MHAPWSSRACSLFCPRALAVKCSRACRRQHPCPCLTAAAQPPPCAVLQYTPADGGPQHASGAASRIIKMQDMPVDPLEPPKFRHIKVGGVGGLGWWLQCR